MLVGVLAKDELPLGVNVYVCVYVVVQGLSLLHAQWSWDRLWSHCNHDQDQQLLKASERIPRPDIYHSSCRLLSVY